MVVERLTKAPELWDFIKNHLPKSLAAYKRDDGYGSVYGITIKEKKKNFFDWNRPLIARVDSNLIEIFHPNYFSDIERIANEYEKKYQVQIVLRVWESIE